jgi:hypothetical protein
LKCGARVTTYEIMESNPGVANGKMRKALEKIMAEVSALLSESNAPEAEETDRPQCEPESSHVDSAVGVGSSR